jgi:hypothetical protein
MRNFVALLTVCGSLLALPAVAPAQTFCVHSDPDCTGTPAANLQAAVTSAANNGVGTRDTIQLPAGRFQDGPVIDVAGNPVDIVGAGRNSTFLQATGNSQIVLSILEPSSTVTGVGVEVTGVGSEVGIRLAGKLDNVEVTRWGDQGAVSGIWVVGPAAEVTNSVVLLSKYTGPSPWAKAVWVDFGGGVTITDSELVGEEGLYVCGGSASLERSAVRAQRGVEAITDGYVSLRNSSVQTPGPAASPNPEVALNARGAGTNIIDALQTTIHGSGGVGSIGAVEIPDPGQAALVDLTDTVLANYQTAAQVAAGATLNTIWSAYKFGDVGGAGAHNHANDLDLTGLDPKFKNGYAGQFALRSDSPLVDAGDPNASTSGEFDRDDLARTRDGDGSGGARVDIGALEYQHAAPEVLAHATPDVVDPGQLVTVIAAAKDADKADGLMLSWSFDDKTVTSGASVQHAFATPGPHTATVTATDSSGLTTSVTVPVTVTGAADPAAPVAPADPIADTPQTPSPPAAAAPLLQSLRLSPATRRAKARSRLSFKLTQPAAVSVVIQRRKGRRWVTTARMKANRAAGAGSLVITGRVHGHLPAAGRYRLRVAARTASGVTSPVRNIAFKIVR